MAKENADVHRQRNHKATLPVSRARTADEGAIHVEVGASQARDLLRREAEVVRTAEDASARSGDAHRAPRRNLENRRGAEHNGVVDSGPRT